MSIAPALPAPSSFRGIIGAAQEDITPPLGIFAKSWGAAEHEASEGTHRPLLLSCLTFQTASNGQPLILIGADLGWWRSYDDEWAIRGAVVETLRIDPARLMICLSHTHAGPGLQIENAHREGGHLIAAYQAQLREAIVGGIRRALEQAGPAVLTWRYGRCDLATNRDLPDPDRSRVVVGFNPDVVADDTLLVGRVTNDEDQITATIVNYACHPTTLAWENKLISPDYVGAMRETIQLQTNGAPCVFLQGASGELAPAEQYSDDTRIADRHGRRLGHVVLATLEAMEQPGRRLAFVSVVESGAPLGIWRQVDYGVPTHFEVEHLRIEYELKPLTSMAEIEAQWRACEDPVLKERLWRKRGVRRVVGDGASTHMPLWVWRLGDSLLLGQPLEAYSQWQKKLRARFSPRAVAVMNIVNGSAGYLAPSDLYDTDIYQVWQSPYARGSLERLIAASIRAAELMDAQ